MNKPDRDAPDTRSLELEVEVPGTPEQIWEAIATGPGITSWLHPTEVEEREGGELSFDMGGGMTFTGKVAGWDPPHRFVEETEWKASEDLPAALLATEWLVEAGSGATCVVRMVTSGFGAGAAWDEEIEGFGEAMRDALDTLRVYLTHFAGRHGSWMRVFGKAEGSLDEAWGAVTGALGVSEVVEGADATVGGFGGPLLSGVVERKSEGGAHMRDLLVRIEDPRPGLASVSVFTEQRFVSVQACLYGDDAAAVAEREEPAWRTWMEERFAAAKS